MSFTSTPAHCTRRSSGQVRGVKYTCDFETLTFLLGRGQMAGLDVAVGGQIGRLRRSAEIADRRRRNGAEGCWSRQQQMLLGRPHTIASARST